MASNPALPFLISSWINLVLYGCEISLFIYYFRHCRSARFQWLLLASLGIDTACSAIVCYNAYLNEVILHGIQPTTHQWPLTAKIILTYSSSFIEQVFYTHRYWMVSRNGFIASIMVFLIITHMVFACYSGGYLIINPELGSDFSVTTTIISAVTCASADLFIALMLIHKLRRLHTVRTGTKSFIRRISLNTLACGFVTSSATSLMLVLLFVSSDAFTILFDALGRIYTLTVLLNLVTLRHFRGYTVNATTNDPAVAEISSQIRRLPYTQSEVSNSMEEIGTRFTIPLELEATDTEFTSTPAEIAHQLPDSLKTSSNHPSLSTPQASEEV